LLLLLVDDLDELGLRGVVSFGLDLLVLSNYWLCNKCVRLVIIVINIARATLIRRTKV